MVFITLGWDRMSLKHKHVGCQGWQDGACRLGDLSSVFRTLVKAERINCKLFSNLYMCIVTYTCSPHCMLISEKININCSNIDPFSISIIPQFIKTC